MEVLELVRGGKLFTLSVSYAVIGVLPQSPRLKNFQHRQYPSWWGAPLEPFQVRHGCCNEIRYATQPGGCAAKDILKSAYTNSDSRITLPEIQCEIA